MGAKIYYKYGTMGSGKSMDLIRTYYNYVERGMNPLVFKSGVDTREGKSSSINSRDGMSIEAIPFFNIGQIYLKLANMRNIDVILFDESQFLSPQDIDEMQKICFDYQIPFIFYGLKVDFQSNLFPGSKRLLEIADDIQVCIGICSCGGKAQQNMRLQNNIPVFTGDQIFIGGNESYIAVCNRCYNNYKRKED